jgi:hypothetical protein
VFANARPHPHHHLIHTTPAPHPIALHRLFTRRARNRAIALGFVAFGPQRPLPPRVCEHAAPAPAPPHPRHATTSPHRPPPPFHTAHPKSSHRARFRGFWPPAPSPASRLRTSSPTTTTTSSTPPHYLPSSPSTAVPHGTPETEPRRLGFNIPLDLYYFISFSLICIGSSIHNILLNLMYPSLYKVVLNNNKIVCLFCKLEALSVECIT